MTCASSSPPIRFSNSAKLPKSVKSLGGFWDVAFQHHLRWTGIQRLTWVVCGYFSSWHRLHYDEWRWKVHKSIISSNATRLWVLINLIVLPNDGEFSLTTANDKENAEQVDKYLLRNMFASFSLFWIRLKMWPRKMQSHEDQHKKTSWVATSIFGLTLGSHVCCRR